TISDTPGRCDYIDDSNDFPDPAADTENPNWKNIEYESVHLDPCDAQNICPFGNLKLHKTCKFVRSYEGCLKTKGCQTLLDRWQGNSAGDFPVEQPDGVCRRLSRDKHPNHCIAFYLLIPCLAKSRHF